jgi:uncharacterized protein
MSDELTPPGEDELRKLLSTEDMDNLPDEDFAYIEPGGTKDAGGKTEPRSKRHYPVQDKAHALNAMQRAEAEIKSNGSGKEIAEHAMPKILDACHKFGIDVGGNSEAKTFIGRDQRGRKVTVEHKPDGTINVWAEDDEDHGPEAKSADQSLIKRQREKYRWGHGDRGKRNANPDEIRALREEMRGNPEDHRIRLSDFEIREVPNGTGGTNLKFEGYASVTCASMDDFSHCYEMQDWLGPYDEGIVRGAFTKTLAESADVAFLANHGGVTMARTKPGTLQLFEDLIGLHVDATLNPSRSDVQILQAAIADGAIDEMSFAFRVVRQTWSWLEDNGEIDRRWIQEVNLDKGDVSPVNYGANPHTGGLVSMRSAMGALLTGRGLTFESWCDALQDLTEQRAGKKFSQSTMDVLQPLHDHLAAMSDMVNEDHPALAELLGLDAAASTDESSDGEQLSTPLYVLPDFTHRAQVDLAAMRRH